MKRWLPIVTAIALVAGLAWSFMYLRALHPFGKSVTDLGEEPLQNVGLRFKGATLIGWANHQRAWQIHARTVDVSRDRRLATFRGVKDSYLMLKGDRVASMTANEVVYNTITRNVSVPGAATLSVKDGPDLKTRKIFWNSARSRLACSGGVIVTVDGSTFGGEKMVADLGKKELTVTKVHGTIRLPE